MASAAASTDRPPATRRSVCGGCGAAALTVFASLPPTPLADVFPAPGEPDGPAWPLDVAVCTSCWLAQLMDVIPDGQLFGSDYAFATGSSPALVAYFRQWAKWARGEFGRRGEPMETHGVLEIGCNDGTLLAEFEGVGYNVYGVDPSAAAGLAPAGMTVLREPFTAEMAVNLPRAGLVIACNVAAHVADPAGFLEGVAAVLVPGGHAVVEFQYLGDLLAGVMLDHVYHEHRFFYSAMSFARLAERAGLYATAVHHTQNQGGSLRMVLAKGVPSLVLPGALVDAETAMRDRTVYDGFAARARYSACMLTDLVNRRIADGMTVAGYGAPAKSATLLTAIGATRAKIAWVEDLTPAKIGRETPGTRIPVIHPRDRPSDPDRFLLLTWNYLSAVLDRERDWHGRGGRFIIPGALPQEV